MTSRSDRIVNALTSGGYSELREQQGSRTERVMPPDVTAARSEFIIESYPGIFNEDEMGDSTTEITPGELTGILAAYEGHLAAKGLLIIKE